MIMIQNILLTFRKYYYLTKFSWQTAEDKATQEKSKVLYILINLGSTSGER